MDHSGHGDAGMSSTSNMQMDMPMYFNVNMPFHVLFSAWLIDTPGKLVAGFFGCFIVAMLYEGLDALRQHLLIRAACQERCPPTEQSVSHTRHSVGPTCPSCPTQNDQTEPLTNPFPSRGSVIVRRIRCMCSLQHVQQTGLHLLQIFVGYMLMLIVMSFNVYMLIGVLAGFTFGYFVFASRRALLLRSHKCCH